MRNVVYSDAELNRIRQQLWHIMENSDYDDSVDTPVFDLDQQVERYARELREGKTDGEFKPSLYRLEAAHWLQLVDAVRSNPSITHFDFHYYLDFIDLPTAQIFASLLRERPNVETVDIGGFVSEVLTNCLLQAMVENPAPPVLKSFYTYHSGPDGLLTGIISRASSTLVKLDLRDLTFDSPEAATAAAAALGRCHMLESLSVRVSWNGVWGLGDVLRNVSKDSHPSFEQLNVNLPRATTQEQLDRFVREQQRLNLDFTLTDLSRGPVLLLDRLLKVLNSSGAAVRNIRIFRVAVDVGEASHNAVQELLHSNESLAGLEFFSCVVSVRTLVSIAKALEGENTALKKLTIWRRYEQYHQYDNVLCSFFTSFSFQHLDFNVKISDKAVAGQLLLAAKENRSFRSVKSIDYSNEYAHVEELLNAYLVFNRRWSQLLHAPRIPRVFWTWLDTLAPAPKSEILNFVLRKRVDLLRERPSQHELSSRTRSGARYSKRARLS